MTQRAEENIFELKDEIGTIWIYSDLKHAGIDKENRIIDFPRDDGRGRNNDMLVGLKVGEEETTQLKLTRVS